MLQTHFKRIFKPKNQLQKVMIIIILYISICRKYLYFMLRIDIGLISHLPKSTILFGFISFGLIPFYLIPFGLIKFPVTETALILIYHLGTDAALVENFRVVVSSNVRIEFEACSSLKIRSNSDLSHLVS